MEGEGERGQDRGGGGWRKGGTVGYQSLCRPVKVATSACDLVVSGRSSSELGLYTSACLPLRRAHSHFVLTPRWCSR